MAENEAIKWYVVHTYSGYANVNDLILHAVVLNSLFKIDLYLVLIAGIGMHDIPFDIRVFRHIRLLEISR